MRKCRLSTCRAELPSIKDSDKWQRLGFCDLDHMAAHGLEKARKSISRAKASQQRQERKEHKEAKQRIKTRSEWLKEAQNAVNAYVRERDKDLPCVSCGRHHQGQYHAGHYRSVGSEPALRFEVLQIWKQCAPCNNHLSGNLIPYRAELLKRVGAETLEWIEGPHEPKKYTIEDLKAIRDEYKAKRRQLETRAAA